MTRATKTWVSLMRFFARSGCHQMPRRSFFVRGYQLPLCARCTGVFFGQLLAVTLAPFGLHSPWFILGLVPLAVDGLTQLARWRESNNPLRLLTGLAGGFGWLSAAISLLLLVFSR